MSRSIFTIPEVMSAIRVIKEFEEGKFSDIPKWHGEVETWTEKAVLLSIDDVPLRRASDFFFPYSQLRKAEDGQSIYATNWILEKKGL